MLGTWQAILAYGEEVRTYVTTLSGKQDRSTWRLDAIVNRVSESLSQEANLKETK